MEVTLVAQYLGHKGAIYGLATTQGGEGHLYSGGSDGYLVRWPWPRNDGYHGNETVGKATIKLPSHIYSLCSYGTLIGAGSSSGDLTFWDDASQIITSQHSLGSPLFAVSLRMDGTWMAINSDGQAFRGHYDIQEREEVGKVGTSRARALLSTPGIVASSDGSLMYGERFEKSIQDAHHHGAFCLETKAKPGLDHYLIYSGGRDAFLRVWEYEAGKLEPLIGYAAHLSTINAISLSPDESLLATASRDKTIRIWKLDLGGLPQPWKTIKDSKHSINALAWGDDTDELHLATGGDDGIVRMYKIE